MGTCSCLPWCAARDGTEACGRERRAAYCFHYRGTDRRIGCFLGHTACCCASVVPQCRLADTPSQCFGAIYADRQPDVCVIAHRPPNLRRDIVDLRIRRDSAETTRASGSSEADHEARSQNGDDGGLHIHRSIDVVGGYTADASHSRRARDRSGERDSRGLRSAGLPRNRGRAGRRWCHHRSAARRWCRHSHAR